MVAETVTFLKYQDFFLTLYWSQTEKKLIMKDVLLKNITTSKDSLKN